MDVHARPFRGDDVRTLDAWRWKYSDADLELPKGYEGTNIKTIVIEKEGKTILSLTGTLVMVLDPAIKDPDADPRDIMRALIKAETVLGYMAAGAGAQDIYIAIPNQLKKYMGIIEKSGYKPTVQNCTVFRRPITPDTEPLIGDIRDQFTRENSASVAASPEDAVK